MNVVSALEQRIRATHPAEYELREDYWPKEKKRKP